MTNKLIQGRALQKALAGKSKMNLGPIITGFSAMGIPVEDIKPRENVFTFAAWLDLGRVVCKDEKGVRLVTFAANERVDRGTGEITCKKRIRSSAVFHISQTKPLQGHASS